MSIEQNSREPKPKRRRLVLKGSAKGCGERHDDGRYLFQSSLRAGQSEVSNAATSSLLCLV